MEKNNLEFEYFEKILKKSELRTKINKKFRMLNSFYIKILKLRKIIKMYLLKISKLKKWCLDLFILKNAFKVALPISLEFSYKIKKKT